MDPIADRVASFDAADLTQTTSLANLDTRIDRKYIVSSAVAEELLGELGETVASLEIEGVRTFRYRSIYFDTPELTLYRQAATGRRRRFKVRTRVYGDSEEAMLEVKTRGARGKTIKVRVPQTGADRHALAGGDRSFVETTAPLPGIADQLRPALETSYIRSTLLDRDHGTRTTLDQRVICTDWQGDSVTLETVVIETKSPGGASQTDRLLWLMGHRPLRISKFCTALAALHPELPSNRWRKTLRRHF